MDNQEPKATEKEGCCSKASKCCGGKSLAALALVLIGGLGGYAAARHCGAKACPMSAASATAPAQTPAK